MTGETSTTTVLQDRFGDARGEAREKRARTRKILGQPRPKASPVIKARIGQYKAKVETARKEGRISKCDDLYVNALMALPTVARGLWSLCSDRTMGKYINRSAGTVGLMRGRLVAAGLLETLDGRDRHMTCLVRPILDGEAVFFEPKTIGRPTTFEAQGTSKVMDDLPLPTSSTESSPPTPPSEPLPDQEECGPSLVARDAVQEPCGPAPVAPDTSPGIPTERSRRRKRRWSGNEGAGARVVDITTGAPRAGADQIFRVELGALGAQLRRLIDPEKFRAWFVNGEARLVSKTDDTVTLSVKDKFFASHITQKFDDVIARAGGVPCANVVVREDVR